MHVTRRRAVLDSLEYASTRPHHCLNEYPRKCFGAIRDGTVFGKLLCQPSPYVVRKDVQFLASPGLIISGLSRDCIRQCPQGPALMGLASFDQVFSVSNFDGPGNRREL